MTLLGLETDVFLSIMSRKQHTMSRNKLILGNTHTTRKNDQIKEQYQLWLWHSSRYQISFVLSTFGSVTVAEISLFRYCLKLLTWIGKSMWAYLDSPVYLHFIITGNYSYQFRNFVSVVIDFLGCCYLT